MGLWERASELGIGAHHSVEERRRIRIGNQAALLAAANGGLFALGFAVAGPRAFWPLLLVNLLGMFLYGVGLVAQRSGRHGLARGLLLATANAHVLAASLLLGRDTGTQFYFLLLVVVSFLVLPRRDGPLVPLVALVSFTGYAWVEYLAPGAGLWVRFDPSVARALHATSAALTTGSLAFLVWLFWDATHRAETALAAEHERSERLLLNVLPSSISERLKAGEEPIADRFDEATVLFADLVGFTELSGRLGAGELATMLGRIFSAFDDLVARLGLEKIKTIGDAYMVVGGIPEARADHAEMVAEMALAMRDALDAIAREIGHPLALRIGMHCGPVVAGVIGKRKFAYDLWGDTVNTASRMESHGAPGRIQVSEAVERKLRGAFTLEPRGVIQVKGKGEMATWFLERPGVP